MAVATVIPCRDEARTIGRLLDALASQTRVPDEIIVVDDQSTDQTRAVVASWQHQHASITLRVVDGPGRGVAAAMNTGIAAATADIIVRLDGHSVPQPDYIQQSLSALAEPGAGVVGGVWTIRPGADTIVARAIAAVVSHPSGSGGAQYRHAGSAPQAAVAVETVPFGTFTVDLWRNIGKFDESLLANEDYDFNYRVRQSGAAVRLDGRIHSQYQARPTLAALGRQYFRYGFWKARMLRKDPSAVHLRQVVAALILPAVAGTVLLAGLIPGRETMALMGMYPAVIVAASAHIAWQARSVLVWPAAATVLVAVHFSWSAGFVRALTGGPTPVASGS